MGRVDRDIGPLSLILLSKTIYNTLYCFRLKSLPLKKQPRAACLFQCHTRPQSCENESVSARVLVYTHNQPAGQVKLLSGISSEIVRGLLWYGRMELPQQGAVNNINNGIEPGVQQVCCEDPALSSVVCVLVVMSTSRVIAAQCQADWPYLG